MKQLSHATRKYTHSHRNVLKSYLVVWKPQITETINFGWAQYKSNNSWPEEAIIRNQFKSYKKIKLAQMNYKHMNNSDQLCGIQFVLTNGLKSPLYQSLHSRKQKTSPKLKTVKIDTSKRIRKVSIKSWNGYAIVGLRLHDEKGKYLVNLNWSAVGSWCTKIIPEDQEIIGLKCNTSNFPGAIP